MDEKILIRNAESIVSCDENDTVYHDADILIENGFIKEIGKNISTDDSKIIHVEHKIIYPGLINTHHHFLSFTVR